MKLFIKLSAISLLGFFLAKHDVGGTRWFFVWFFIMIGPWVGMFSLILNGLINFSFRINLKEKD